MYLKSSSCAFFSTCRYRCIAIFHGCVNTFARRYTDALRIQPDYADAYLAMGLARTALGQHVAAIAAFKRALKIQPDWLVAKEHLAEILTAEAGNAPNGPAR